MRNLLVDCLTIFERVSQNRWFPGELSSSSFVCVLCKRIGRKYLCWENLLGVWWENAANILSIFRNRSISSSWLFSEGILCQWKLCYARNEPSEKMLLFSCSFAFGNSHTEHYWKIFVLKWGESSLSLKDALYTIKISAEKASLWNIEHKRYDFYSVLQRPNIQEIKSHRWDFC